ncbi:MAG: D-alanyl-D-alanine carboxypeptidase [Firmicutes bacterium]|nr:D-alanyl-D-alanine carboxypeptidase [Bacillota bacterium]
MKRTLFLITLIFFIIAFTSPAFIVTQRVANATVAPTINSPSAILIDEKTGDILWQKNADERRAIASTTKIMTAILAIEKKSLDETVTVGENVVLARENGMKLSPGEKIKLRDLLSALMLNSANDAAIAVAEYVGGSVEGFLGLMNQKALELGAKNSNFTSPNGLINNHELNSTAHFSTARDLAIISRHAMKNKTFAAIVATKEDTLTRDGSKPAVVINRNKLLWSYPGANGIKTGHTNEAGYCLVSSAAKEGVSLIAVVLGSKSQDAVFDESASLLNYGFAQFEQKKLVKKGAILKTIKLDYGQKLNLVAESDVTATVRRSFKTFAKTDIKKNIKAPVKKGAVLGNLTIYQSDYPVAHVRLVADRGVKKPTFIQVIRFYWHRFLKRIY